MENGRRQAKKQKNKKKKTKRKNSMGLIIYKHMQAMAMHSKG